MLYKEVLLLATLDICVFLNRSLSAEPFGLLLGQAFRSQRVGSQQGQQCRGPGLCLARRTGKLADPVQKGMLPGQKLSINVLHLGLISFPL